MSQPARTIAAAPVRTASEAWEEVARMIAETLEPADVDDAAVTVELDALADIGRLLISGGHLSATPLALVAEPLRLAIQVVDGTAATKVEEKLGLVAGAATASDWELWVPTPTSLEAWVNAAVEPLDHVRAGEPAHKAARAEEGRAISFDVDALSAITGEQK